MNKGRRRGLCLLLAAIMLLTGCAEKQTDTDIANNDESGWRVIVATDLHYLAPTLTDHGELFRQVMEAGDGKVTELCDEITDAFLAEVRENGPDALILTGDLSFNGERESHLALAQKLSALEAEGVPVLVLPGNHDLYRTCYSFFGEKGEQVDTVDADTFREIYGPFGFEEAIACDGDSLSYAAQLNDSTRILMLDANTMHDFCSLSEKTLVWIENQLKAAAEDGQMMLVACHQNLYQHSMFRAGYVLRCAEDLKTILEEYEATLFVSGHMHIQHIMTEGNVTEIVTSALTMGQCRYGLLEQTNDHIRYEAKPVAVADWAAREGLNDERLSYFAAYAIERLESRTRAQAESQLAERGFVPDEIVLLTDYACALNTAYFCGDLSGLPLLDPEGKLLARWKESESFFGSYFATIEPEIGKDHTKWEKQAN